MPQIFTAPTWGAGMGAGDSAAAAHARAACGGRCDVVGVRRSGSVGGGGAAGGGVGAAGVTGARRLARAGAWGTGGWFIQ